MTGRSGIETMLGLLDEAFRGPGIEATDESQALLPNIAAVPDDAWQALSAGSARTIASIVIHVGACKIMYDDYAFGGGSLRFATPAVEPWNEDDAPRREVMTWLEAAHDRLVADVVSLADDDELDLPRPTNWGDPRPTRWIIASMITHDAYHAGEINHLRSSLGGDDRWRHISSASR